MTLTDSVSISKEVARPPASCCSVSMWDIAFVVAAVAGALVAATGAVTLVALAQPNLLGPLNAFCSLGPYGGLAFLTGGTLVAAIAVSNCLLGGATPYRSDKRGGGGKNHVEKLSSAPTEVKALQKSLENAPQETTVNNDNFSTQHAELPQDFDLSTDEDSSDDSDFKKNSFKVILYNFPKTADSFVEQTINKPEELATLINYPQTLFDDVLGSIAILRAIRRREDNVFEKVMQSCLQSERIPFELFVPKFTDAEAKTIVNLCNNNTHRLTALRSTYTAMYKIPGGLIDIDALRAKLLSAMQERNRGRVRFALEEFKTEVAQECIPPNETRRIKVQQSLQKTIQADIDALSQ